MSEIKISVVLPIYNDEKYLEKCLDDILGQTLEAIEVICINDGSTDNTLAILRKYEMKDSRIIVLDRPQSGAAKSRNAGLAIARGEYISFLDADDFYEHNMLEDAYKACKKHNADICIFRGDRYANDTGEYITMAYSVKDKLLPKRNPFSYKDIPDDIFSFAVGWAWDKLYRREFVITEKLMFQDLRTSNDLFFVFSSFVKARSIYILDEHLVHHRINVENSLSVTRERSWNCFYLAASRLKKELISMGIYNEEKKAFVNWALHFCFWNLDTINNEAYENVYQLIKDKCIDEFEFTQHEREFYADKRLYDRMIQINKLDYKQYLLDNYQTLKVRNEEQSKKISDLQKKVKACQEKSKKLCNSLEYKIGRVVTYIPRRIKKLLKK